MDILCADARVCDSSCRPNSRHPAKKRLFSWHRWVKLRKRKHKRRKPGEQHWAPRPGCLENPVFQSRHCGWELLITTIVGQPWNQFHSEPPTFFWSDKLDKRPSDSLCRPTATLPLLTSRYTCTRMHTWTRQHTHVPSPLTRGGANEEKGGAVRRLLSVPCCYLRSCMLLSWAMFSLLL